MMQLPFDSRIEHTFSGSMAKYRLPLNSMPFLCVAVTKIIFSANYFLFGLNINSINKCIIFLAIKKIHVFYVNLVLAMFH